MTYCAVTNYDWLVNGTAMAQLKQFMEEDRSFDEYIKVKSSFSLCSRSVLRKLFTKRCDLRPVLQRAEEFKLVSKEIVSLSSKAFFHMVHLDCEELKQGLVSKANSYAEVLLEKMITCLREENKQSVTRHSSTRFASLCLRSSQ